MKVRALTPSGVVLLIILIGISYLYLKYEARINDISACVTGSNRPYYLRRDLRPFEFSTDFFGLTYVGYSKDYIDSHILYFGAYEKPELFFLRDISKALAGSEAVFVDVGANVGQHSLFMSQHASKVIAFEPYPPVVARFRHLMELNKLRNVELYDVGLGDSLAEVPYFPPDEGNQGTGSFIPGFNDASEAKESFQIVPGDEWFAQNGIDKTHVMKIDVEGYEKAVILGLKDSIKRDRPVMLLELTVGHEHGYQSEAELKASLPDYKFIRFGGNRISGKYRYKKFNWLSDKRWQASLVAYPKEKEGLLPKGSE